MDCAGHRRLSEHRRDGGPDGFVPAGRRAGDVRARASPSLPPMTSISSASDCRIGPSATRRTASRRRNSSTSGVPSTTSAGRSTSSSTTAGFETVCTVDCTQSYKHTCLEFQILPEPRSPERTTGVPTNLEQYRLVSGEPPAPVGCSSREPRGNHLRRDERERELTAVIIENDDQVEVRRDAAGQPEEDGADAGRVPTDRAREAPGGE